MGHVKQELGIIITVFCCVRGEQRKDIFQERRVERMCTEEHTQVTMCLKREEGCLPWFQVAL